jgi:hypothetical protein
MTSARERATALRQRWYHFIVPPSVRDEFYRDTEAALLAEREAALEDAAKVADTFTCGLCGMDGKAAAVIRALLNQKEERE